jgi:hypothetical protein
MVWLSSIMSFIVCGDDRSGTRRKGMGRQEMREGNLVEE